MRPPEEVKRDLVRQWQAKADEDLDVARALLSLEMPFPFAVGFHSQQAAEKYLKALLVWHQVEFPKTHNLGELLDLVSTVDQHLATLLRDATALNPYGVEIRYPGDVSEISMEEARDAVALAEKVRDAVLGSLVVVL